MEEYQVQSDFFPSTNWNIRMKKIDAGLIIHMEIENRIDNQTMDI